MERKHSRNAAHVHGWDDFGRQVRTTWAMWNVMWTRQTIQLQTACSVLNAAWSACLRALRHSCCCPQWSHRCWKCASSRTLFVVAICRRHLFVNFCIRRYYIYKNLGHGKTCGAIFNPILADQNTHASWNPSNLRESTLERLNQKIMRIAMVGRDSIRRDITILCTSSFLCSKQWKSQMRKPLLTRSGKSLKMCLHGKWRKSTAKGGHSRDTERVDNSSFCAVGHIPPQKHWVGSEVPKTQDVWYYEGTLLKMILALLSRKSYGCYCKPAKMRRTSSWYSIRLCRRQNGGRSSIDENFPSRSVQTSGHVSHDTGVMHSCCAVSLQCCCQSVHSDNDPMHLAQVTKHIVCVSPKNIHTSSRNIVHLAALDDTTHGHSFLTFSWTSLTGSRTILRRSEATAEWRFLLSPDHLQVMSPSSLLKTGSPETVSSLNTRIYVPKTCPSTSRSKRQPMTQQKALRHRSRNRTWRTNNFVLCWLHHCTYSSEKQVQNDRKFITLNEKTWCPVHLKIRCAQWNLSQCFQAKIGWIKTHFPIETNFPEDIKRFLGAMNLSSDSLHWQMLRNLFLMETEITCLLKRDLNSWNRNAKWNLLTLALVNFSSKPMLSDWKWRTPISDV